MKTPPYFRQINSSGCSIAILRMVLATKHIQVSEEELINRIVKDYGKNFTNIWNSTIAKLAQEYGLLVTFYAKWALFKNMSKALEEFHNSSSTFNVDTYENKNDKDTMLEPLSIADIDMFNAVEKGCKYVYSGLDKELLKDMLSKNNFIQLSIRLKNLYPEKYKKGYHSILLYGIDGEDVIYHDPYNGEALRVSIDKLLQSTMDAGACMIYSN